MVAADRELAVVAARRADLIDQVRRWSRFSVDALAQARGQERGSIEDHRIASRSTTAELACSLRVPEGSAMVLLDEAQALVHELPATMTALGEGTLSYRHAQVVMSATAALDEGPTLVLDAILAERAKTTTVAHLGRVARRARERHDPRPLVERHTVALVERRVELEPGRDGMSWLHQLMPAVHAAAIFNRLSDIAISCQGPEETRTLAQLRADACIELLLDDDARAAADGGSAWTAPHGTDSQHFSSSQPGSDSLRGSDPRRGSSSQPASDSERGSSSQPGSGRASSSSGELDPSPQEPSTPQHLRSRGTSTTPALSTSGGPTSPAALEHPSTRAPGSTLPVSVRGIRPVVAVTVPVMTLLGHSEEPGDLAGYGPIDAATARELAAHATSFIRLLTHPETGTVLSVGRDRYAVPADLRTWLQIRDDTCRFPGCSRRAARCDVDHITDWARGGTTSHSNLIHLCRKHHRLKHTTRWTPRMASTITEGTSQSPAEETASHTDDSVVHWDAPSGRTHLDHPAVQLSDPVGRSGHVAVTPKTPARGTPIRTGLPEGRTDHDLGDHPPS
ncbi:HNH endonuclease signature motif containing protein [Sanguibacter inulinus]